MEERNVTTVDELLTLKGKDLGRGDWITIEQSRVDQFADAIGDHQWIHCDPERAARDSPYGTTIAHGALLLSLVSLLRESLRGIRIDLPARMGVFYGLNRVRFVAPVPVGRRIRLSQTLKDVDVIDARTVQMVYSEIIELEGEERPAVVIEAINRKFLS